MHHTAYKATLTKTLLHYLIGKYLQATILPNHPEDALRPQNAPNPNLRWEKTQNVNAGLDLSLWDNAISLSVDYYYRKGTDLIGMRMLPLESGYSSTTVNWASMKNQGVEVALTTRNIHTKDFTWFTNLNFGFNDNTVLEETVAENSTTPSREGYPVGAIFAYKTAGLDDEATPYILQKTDKNFQQKTFSN